MMTEPPHEPTTTTRNDEPSRTVTESCVQRDNEGRAERAGGGKRGAHPFGDYAVSIGAIASAAPLPDHSHSGRSWLSVVASAKLTCRYHARCERRMTSMAGM